MTWEIAWTARALRDAARLDQRTRDRISDALTRLSTTGHGDVAPLQGHHPPEWRLRVGDWRVIFSYEADVGTIRIHQVRPRDRAYR